MNNIKFASPLFILRKQCETDLYGVLEQLKKAGYDGIEFLGFFGKEPVEIRQKLDELGLVALGNHVPYNNFLEDAQNTIKIHKILGCSCMTICSFPAECLPNGDKFSEAVENVNKWAKMCREDGITLLFHNHKSEVQDNINGKLFLDLIMDGISEISLEPDLGWIEIGGVDCTKYLEKYVNRCPVLHFKDFYAEDISKIVVNDQENIAEHGNFAFRPTGYGIMNYPKIMKKALKCNPKWIVLDHDNAYSRDSVYELKLSLEYTKNLLNLMSLIDNDNFL